tara:strand:- start:113 stop:1396 length:1284 start_codon:yes stop_codon:yes gene_type:complete
MSSNLINPDYSPLRAAEEDGSSSGGSEEGMGLVAGLEAFIEENPDAPIDDSSSEAESLATEEAPPKAESSDESSLEIDEDNFGLPTLGKETESAELPDKEEVDTSFDEAAFDQETDQEVKGLDPGKGEAWKKLKEELKSYKKGEIQLPELQKKMAALEKENESLRQTADEVEAIKARMQSVTSRNAELLLEESEEYQEQVVRPHNTISSTIAALADAKGVTEDEIWSVIRESDPARRISRLDELEREIGARNALVVQNMATDMRVIAAKDQEMRENADKIVDQARSAQARADEEQMATKSADFKTSTNQAFELHASKIPGFVDESGTLTDIGRSARANTSIVDLSSLSSGDLAYMAFATEALPQSLRQIRSLEKENRDLRVAAGDKSSDILPGGTRKKTVDDDVDSDTGRPMGLLDHMAKQTFDSAL